MLCAECGSEMRRCTDPIKETFRGEEIMVTGIEHYLCDSCGEILFGSNEGKDFDAEILRQYALRENLLTPQEIKTIRKRRAEPARLRKSPWGVFAVRLSMGDREGTTIKALGPIDESVR